jgi:aryl-alcohol dehydrogenase-like predicted oxidoreductase
MQISTDSDKNKPVKYKKLGKSGLNVSICGFGSYRIDQGMNLHRQALEFALKNGINLIDTSANYSDGGSELLIGQVLEGQFKAGSISRDELVVVTKGGYMQGENLRFALEREQSGRPYKEVVKCTADLWHCIHPRFIEDQISASLRRLKLKKIDVYLLHNPEYYLLYTENLPAEEKTTEYYNRIKKAFLYLEKEVQRGRISWYGISSNTFVEENSHPGFTSLEKVLEITGEKEKFNHFAVIQFPVNLLEKGGIKNINQAKNHTTLLKLASENNLGVMINRPLNAISNEKLVRLADYEIKTERSKDEIAAMVRDLAVQESFITSEFVDKSDFSSSEKKSLYDCLSLASILTNNYQSFESPNHFEEIKNYYIIPRADYAISQLVDRKTKDEELIKAVKKYAFAINSVLGSIDGYLAKKHNDRNAELHEKLNTYLFEEQQKLTLSGKAVLMINSLPEVSSTLIGMRKVKFVKDMLECMRSEYVKDAYKFWLSG